ncbi:hypothetical protein HZS_2377 [Henneguya salminicola]|nr:hypothetical protein HZS_2377 [Henneguya salminicola]
MVARELPQEALRVPQISRSVVGAPQETCESDHIRCGNVYSCDIFPETNISKCYAINNIHDKMEKAFNNDLLGYHIEHHKGWGTIVCAPLKQNSVDSKIRWKGWCGKMDQHYNITSHRIGDLDDKIKTKKEWSSLGYSSVYLKKFGVLAISDPVSFNGRGRISIFDSDLNLLDRKYIGYIKYGYPGLKIKNIELDKDIRKTCIQKLFLMEIRRDDQTTSNGFVSQITELENIIDPLHSLYSQVGWDFLCVDINGDIWEDIIVSLPFYNDGRGAVSQLITTRQNNKFSKFISIRNLVGDNQDECLFGYSLALIGDLNQDGISDLAISAPFCSPKTGGGAVYIYLSRKHYGFSDPYFEKIIESKFRIPLYSFGMKIKSEFDVNFDNKYDLAISAPLSNKILILKMNNLILITAFFQYSKKMIDEVMSSQCMESITARMIPCVPIKICFNLSSNNIIAQNSYIKFSVSEIDLNNRAYIISNESLIKYERRLNIENNQIECTDLLIGFKRPFSLYHKSIIYKMDYQFEYNAQYTEYFDYFINIRSNGESAFEPILKIIVSKSIEILEFEYYGWTPTNSQILAESNEDFEYRLQLPSVMKNNDTVFLLKRMKIGIKIKFGVTKLTNENDRISIAFILECFNDINLQDNSLFFEIKTKYKYKLGVNADIVPYQLMLYEKEGSESNLYTIDAEKSALKLSYLIINQGPSMAKNANFTNADHMELKFHAFIEGENISPVKLMALVTKMDSRSSKKIPIWLIVVSVIGGIISFVFIIFVIMNINKWQKNKIKTKKIDSYKRLLSVSKV